MTKKRLITTLTAATIALTTLTTPWVPFHPTVVQAATEALQPPDFSSRAEIPNRYKWKTEHIYANQQTWEEDASKLETLAEEFLQHQGKIGQSPSYFKEILNDYSELLQLCDKLYVFANLSFDVHQDNPELQELADRADRLYDLVTEKTSWFNSELAELPEETVEKYLTSNELATYRLFIESSLEFKEHTLARDAEALLAQTSPLMGVPEGVFSMFSKDLKLPAIKDENGQMVQLTPANYVSFLESPDPEVRKAAFQAYYHTLEDFQDTWAQILAGQVKANNFYAKARKFNSALESSLLSNGVPPEVYEELIDTVNQHLPLLHRYVELRKRMLGLEELHMYDLILPIVDSNYDYIPYEQAREMVLKGLKPLGDEYLQVLKAGMQNGWVDVYSTEDKRSGAYQWGAYDTHPYVLLNYQGTYEDVLTLAHELGHAMQTYYTNRKQPYLYSNYPIFTAEVASTMNETLMFKSMYALAQTNQEKMYLLNQYLDSFRSALFRQTMLAEFEKLIHEQEQAGAALTAEAMKQWYLDINQKYYGPSMISDEEVAMEWARIPHLYWDFYVYQYATSFAASAALANQVLEEGKPAVDRIRDNFLSAGSSDGPLQVLQAAGVDMSTSQPIVDAMKIFEETLDELERLIEETEIKIKVNGEKLSLDQAPLQQEGRTLVPVRSIAEALGATVSWENDQTILIKKENLTVTIKPDSTEAIVNGKTIKLDIPARLAAGRTYVPTRLVSEALGASVEWDEQNRTVVVEGK
ncbi:oligoendopeptidase F [Ammoniphilus sp. CFH 90114]|uniref:oligoendopeptidase F n=1 Tax=Ammoniphilus sp. CFH 90114 TaxID=2493665 RepID=UPI0013E96360|nr:oligoendopeptidase F [Ammoniphilus sp. CFH 90114]